MKTPCIALFIFISSFVFSQQELEISNKFKTHFYEPYIANDGTYAVMESNGTRKYIRTFDAQGRFLNEFDFKFFFDLFDPLHKCWIFFGYGFSKITITQLDFSGKITETEFKYNETSRKGYGKYLVRLNKKGNVELYVSSMFGTIPYICVEYNPKDQSSQVQDFSIAEGISGQVRLIGKRGDETYFVNWEIGAFAEKAKVNIYAIDSKNTLRAVSELEFPNKNVKDFLYYSIRMFPYIDNNESESIEFLLVFRTFQEKMSKMVTTKDYRETFKICRIEKNDKLSMLDFDPQKYPDLEGTFSILMDTDESETSLLVLKKENSDAIVYATDFDEPLGNLNPEIYPHLKIPELAFGEKKYLDLYKVATDCKRGTFRICDDGVARLLVISKENKAFFYESRQ